MRSKHSILAGLLLLLPLLVSAQTWKEQEIIVFTDSLLHATYSDTEPGAAVLIARNGKVVHAQGYGLASLELGVANEPDNLFDIGSMSKQFTAVAILQLVDKGLADLDTDVRTYIPEYNTHDHTITLRHLLTHTSGITSFTELDTFATLYNKDMGREEIMDLFMEPELLFTPDNDWSYSNSGFTLAGMIVEKISGQSFPEYMQEHIFQPAGMQHTYIGNLNQVFPKKYPDIHPENMAGYPQENSAGTGHLPPGPSSLQWKICYCGMKHYIVISWYHKRPCNRHLNPICWQMEPIPTTDLDGEYQSIRN